MRASRFRVLIPPAILVAVVLASTVAGAQTPMPGEELEVTREWTWWLSLPVLAGAFGLALLILVSYLRLSTRFYGKEEAPPPRPRPQYAGVNAPAYPAPTAPQQAPAQPPAREQAPAPQQPAEEKPAEEKPAEEKPAEEKPAEEKPAEAPKAEEAPKAAAEPSAAAGSEDDVYERVLKEQLDKGVSPKVAEGRAKAAAVKAKRQQGGE